MDIEKYMKQLETHSLALYEKKKESQPSMTPHQQKVHGEIISGNFGCRRELVLKFASAFMNYDFKIDGGVISHEDGMIIVILRHPNGQNYQLNVPIIITQAKEGYGSLAYRQDYKDIVNNLPVFLEQHGRLATPKEISSFYQGLSKTDKEKISKYLLDKIPYKE